MSEIAYAICIGVVAFFSCVVVEEDGTSNADDDAPAVEDGMLTLAAMMDCSQSIRGRSNATSRMNKSRPRELIFGFDVAPRRCASLAGG